MKSESWLIAEFGAALLLLGILSFFFTPVYEKGSYFVMGVFASQFANVLGYKFGRSMPEQSNAPQVPQVPQIPQLPQVPSTEVKP